MGTPDIVIDTNILVAAQRSQRGASSKLVTLLGQDHVVSHISVPLILEYESVLMRQHQELGITTTTEDVLDVVDAMCHLSQWHEIYYLWRPLLPDEKDEKDEMLLELAIKADAADIITYNVRDFKGASDFGVEVMTPNTLLEKLGVIK